MTTVDSWDPSQEKQLAAAGKDINQDVLLQLAGISASGQLDNISSALSAEQVNDYRHLMKHHKDDWQTAGAELNEETLIHLVRFFTLAEEQLAGWEAGSLSPVIWLCRELKKRGAFPDPDLISWIKSQSSNKFLPYGNILDL